MSDPDPAQVNDLAMASLQDKMVINTQEAVNAINCILDQRRNERSRYEALLRDHAKLEESIAAQSIAHQIDLERLNEANRKLTCTLDHAEKCHTKECLALAQGLMQFKDESAGKEATIRDLRKETTEKDDQIGKLNQKLAEIAHARGIFSRRIRVLERKDAESKGLTLEPSSKTQGYVRNNGQPEQDDQGATSNKAVSNEISIPLLHQMVPYEPEAKGGEPLIQFLKVLGCKEQDDLDTIHARVEAIHTAMMTHNLQMESFMPAISDLVTSLATNTRIGNCHREILKLLLPLLSSKQVETDHVLLRSKLGELVLNHFKYHEFLQHRNGAQVFQHVSGTITEVERRKRKRKFEEEKGTRFEVGRQRAFARV